MTTWKTYLVKPLPLPISALAQQQLLAKVPPLIYSPPANYTKINSKSSGLLSKSSDLLGKNQPRGHFSETFTQYPLRLARYHGMWDKPLKTFPIDSVSSETHKQSKFKRECPTLDTSGKKGSNVAGALRRRARRFNCPSCSRKFYYMCHLKVHERVHTREKPYVCDICRRSFSQSGSLRVHMRRHTGVKPYECFKCWRKFRHVNSLLRHQRQVHNCSNQTGIKPTACENGSRSITNAPDKPEREVKIPGASRPVNYVGLRLPGTYQTPWTVRADMDCRQRALRHLCLGRDAFETSVF